MHIFHIVIDSNQDKEDQEEMEPEEGNGMHLLVTKLLIENYIFFFFFFLLNSELVLDTSCNVHFGVLVISRSF